MASNETGECCVCGKETADRCGACAEADFALFFCSREHQKLIWPVHKRVCGPGKCNPFRCPDLTEEEAKDVKKHAETVYQVDGVNCRTLLEEVCEMARYAAAARAALQ
ncbi:hypothetical protein JCM10213v2_003636 [Rhodosporidiobolus nylandii]